MNARPQFLRSKGERRSPFPDFDPLSRYEVIAKGIYKWEGLPEDVPEGYIEQSLFNWGAVGAKNVPGLGVCIMPAASLIRTIYNTPSTWLPIGIVTPPLATPGLLEESDTPVLWLGESPASRAEMYASIMYHAALSLRQNVISLRQPIALDGEVGNSADAAVIRCEIESGEQYIPVLQAARLGVQVIDLKAHDYTQQLIATMNAMDSEILTILGVSNAGTEKASGVTAVESTSIKQELALINDVGLMLREQWCLRINAALGTDFGVHVGDGYEPEDVPEDVPEDGGESNVESAN